MEKNIFGIEAIQVVVTGTRNTSDSIDLSVIYWSESPEIESRWGAFITFYKNFWNALYGQIMCNLEILKMLAKILKMMYFHPYQSLKMSHTTFIFPYDMST